MNYLPKIFLHNFLFAATLLLSSFVFASESIPIESTVIFNTACARCHEGECSGRMSFHLPEKAANQHITRHGGELTAENIRHLFQLLRYMKEKCSFYPLHVALINDQRWGKEMLNQFRSPSKLAYFMPLGLLEPGQYQLLFEESNSTRFCAEIISEEFDFTDTDSLYGESGKKILKFDIEEGSKYFLRLTAQKAITLINLELVKE